MHSKFDTEQPYTSDDSDFSTSGDAIFASLAPWLGDGGGSTSGQNNPNSTVAVTSGGIIINLLFDAAAMAAPASFRAGIQQAAALLGAAIFDPITVNLKIHYTGTGGGAFAGPDAGVYENYSTIRADLISNATPGDTTFNALPGGSSIQSQSTVAVWNAQLKLWGFLGANDTTTDDGAATFATDINPNLLVGVALHELTHALGRIPYGPQPDIFDLFRFTSAGTRLFQGGATAPAAFFSVDGGTTKLADFGQSSDSSDFLNSGVQGPNDPFDEFYNGSTVQGLSAVDKQILDALGFHTMQTVVTTVIESFGSTKLDQVGSNYFLDGINSGTGPELKYGGAPVVAGQFGIVAPIGAEQTGSGYNIAWQVPGTNQFTFWTTDSNGNYTSNITGLVSRSSFAVESLETTFGQDLNGDGTIGVTSSLIQRDGSTSLLQIADNYYMYVGGVGPELKYGGAPVTVGEFGAIAPIGAVQTAGGYDIAWQVPGTNQFTFWTTDSNGNYISNITGLMSGSSIAVESLEITFGQDLNGDGMIGPPSSLIQQDGSTSLLQIADNYYMYVGGSGPELKYGGAPVTVGEFGAIAPIGAVQTASGYDIAWQVPGTNEFTFWTTDSNGNYISNITGLVSGSSIAVESLETTFGQDLNGDGTLGVTSSLIQRDGSTSLLQIADNYYMYVGGSGPELKYGGAPVTVGEFGAIAPIGAVQTANGYDIAWKIPGTNEFTFWTTDSNGNYTSNITGLVSGTDATLGSLETVFHQDFNGDGVIGGAAPASPAAAADANSTPAIFTGSTLTLDPSSTFSGQFIGFAGDGTLQGSDQIDLRGMNYNSIHSTYESWSGILAVTDGTNTTHLQFLGNYSQDNFKFADDGGGGSTVYAQLASSQPPLLGGSDAAPIQVAGNNASTVGQDTFVFAPNFGHITITHFTAETNTIQISKTVFANIDALWAAIHDDPHGNAVITDAAHDTIAVQNVTVAQLQAHQDDFHLI